MATVEETLARLSKSTFRARFRLNERDRAYAKRVGREKIASHAADFIRDRLAPAEIPNDGHQTPMRGHPVFVAQHACACCCRGCLSKWYHIPPGRPLSDDEQARIVRLLLAWIDRQIELPLFGHKWVRDPSAERISVDLEEGQITEFDDPD